MPMDADRKVITKLVKGMKREDQDPLRPLVDLYLMRRDRVESERRIRAYMIDLVARPRPPGRLSPSSMGGCQRLAAFKFVGVRGRRRVDPDSELIFDDGNWRHHKWQATFKDMELVLGRDKFRVLGIEEVVEIPELYISGSLDVVVAIYRNGHWEKWVIDIKGINDAGFTYVHNNRAPKEEHVRQLTTYEKARKVVRGLLWYENKNNQLTMGHVVRLDGEVWAEVEDWTSEVLDHLQAKRVPPMHPDCQAGTYLWERCPYKPLCYGNATPVQIRRKAYKDFESVETQWAIGKGLEAAG